MKSVSMIKVLLALAALALTSVAMAEEAPWVIDNIVKTGSADTTEPSADGSCLQIELKVAPSAKNVPWHNFKIVDVSGKVVGSLDSWDEETRTLFFDGDWSKVVGLYLEGMGNRQELFPNAVVQDVEPVKPVAPVIKPAVINDIPSYPLRYEEPIARTERHVIDNVERVVNVHHDGVRTYYDGHRDVYVDDHNHVVHHGGDVYHDDVHHHGGGGVGGHGHGHAHGGSGGHGHGDAVADGGTGGCSCGHCDGNHGDGCTCAECAGKGGDGTGAGAGDGSGCKYCGGTGCAKCGDGPGSPWEMDAYAKNVGQGNKLAMGAGKGAYGEEAPGCGCGEGKGPGTGDGDGDDCGCDDGEGTAPGEGEGPGPGEGTGPGPGEGEGPVPDEGEGPLPDEGEEAAPGEGPGPGEDCGCGPEPGPNPMEPPTGPEPNAPAPGPGPAPGTAPGMGPGGPGAYGPNMVNLAPQVRPRVKNLAKNFFKKPPVIDGPEIYVFNPQKPYYNPQVPYYGYNQGYGYGGGYGAGGGGGGGAYGNIPEGAFDFKKPEYEDHFVLYISTGNDKTEGIVYQVDENGRILGQVRLPYTATGLAIHRDNGLVCAAPRDGGKIYRINDSGKMETVMENNEDVVHPSDVAVGYNSDSMILADDLAKTLTLSNTAGVKPTTYKRIKGSKYEQPKMSVAAGRDKAVLFSSDENPGVDRYTGNATETEPVLPKSGAVAASNANDNWAATQDNSIVVMEGTQEQYSFDVPSTHRVYKKGMLSFAPRDSVVTAVQQADGDQAPWLMMFRKDENGENKCRALFKWDEEKYGEMQDFVVGPRMYWEQNERKTMKSMY